MLKHKVNFSVILSVITCSIIFGMLGVELKSMLLEYLDYRNSITIEKNPLDIKERFITILNSINITNKSNIFFFVYVDNYSKRVIVIDNEGENISEPLDITPSQIAHIQALDYHKHNLCYMRRTTNLPKEGLLYNALKNNGNITPNNFYVSCPVFHKKTLRGYISLIFSSGNNGVVVDLDMVKLIAAKIEDYYNSL